MKINTKLQGNVAMDTVLFLIATSLRVARESAAELDSGTKNRSFLFIAAEAEGE